MADKRVETMGISRTIRPSTWDFMGLTRQKYTKSWRCHANFMVIGIEWEVNWHKKRAKIPKMNRNRDLINWDISWYMIYLTLC